jgi:alkanesulfonate monooxygenase SsuD/methylene tetrahydromethanopterin reductase-like flavin-dependent oxidoreductase (luciferase family)
MPGRFFFGVARAKISTSTSLAINWPPFDVRLEMLNEASTDPPAVEGGSQSYTGQYYVVENARIFTMPDELPPIMIAASGANSAELAGEIGDGLISTAPDEEVVGAFMQNGDANRRATAAYRVLGQRRRGRPAHRVPVVADRGARRRARAGIAAAGTFEQAVKTSDEDDVAERVVCGPDRSRIATASGIP